MDQKSSSTDMVTKAMKTVRAAMTWKGRKLLCNGQTVADIWSPRPDLHYPLIWAGGQKAKKTERAARRAVNKRFGLPLDFGARP